MATNRNSLIDYKALSDFSDVKFTKDRQMSKDAAIILQQLD